MSIQSIANQHSMYYSLDEILQDIPETATEDPADIDENIYKEDLNFELKTADRVWLEFQAGQCEQYGKVAKSILYRIVKSSAKHPENSVAAANAITILKTMKISFSCLDLKGVQIPGADLSSAILDGADVSGANLDSADLTNASLNSVRMSKTNLEKVRFGLPNILDHDDNILFIEFSPNNKYLVTRAFYIYIWDLSSKKCIKKINYPISFNKLIFTPDSQFLFFYDEEQNLDIWSVDNFEPIKKLKISHTIPQEVNKNASLFFSPNGTHLIITNFLEDGENQFRYYLGVFELQKNEEKNLNIILKNEIIVPYYVHELHFSKKFPIFYFIKTKTNEQQALGIDLCIWNTEELSEVSNVPDIGEPLIFENVRQKFIKGLLNLQMPSTIFPLDIWDTCKHNEELIFIAINNSIYFVNILIKNGQNWALDSFHVTEVITDIDFIHSIQTLAKTKELAYACGDCICLYSISNNLLIGRYRLLDTFINQFFISLNGENLYISSLDRIFVHSVEALKNSKYFSYQIDNVAACFSTDMHSIISVSNKFYMTIYDIENGSQLESYFLRQRPPSYFSRHSRHYIDDALLSTNSQFIFLNSSEFLYIIPGNKEEYFESTLDNDASILSNISKYLAFIYQETLYVYETSSCKRYACYSPFEVSFLTKIAISTDFHNAPKIGLIDEKNKIIICNLVFNIDALELLSKKELQLGINDEALQLMFTENDSKLIIAYKEKIIIWHIVYNQYEEYVIQAECVAISHDGSFLICSNWSKFDSDISKHQLCLYSIAEKKIRIVQPISLAITKLQLSPDNRYILATTDNGGMYVWKIVGNTFRLLWRTSHNLQTQGLILGSNNIEKDVEDVLIIKMGAIKIADK